MFTAMMTTSSTIQCGAQFGGYFRLKKFAKIRYFVAL
jgi:hypothetical protein